jgi:hypothetical protein
MKRAGGPFSAKKGPGILMDAVDHAQTASWGPLGKEYCDMQVKMLNEGRFLDVLARDIQDVQAVAPGEYDTVIQQMLDHLWSGNW